MINSEKILWNNIPIILWGSCSKKVYIYVHGKMGNKEEAKNFAELVDRKGYQTISFDLPKHGERVDESYSNNIWNGIHDLKLIANYAREHWSEINLYACSIGAFYSLMAYGELPIKNCLFQSPVLDMEKLIVNMMSWANVSEEQLRKEKIIETNFGESLDWDYFTYVKAHPITKWEPMTHVLYGMKDNMTDIGTLKKFAEKFNCNIDAYDHMEHHLHTKEDLEILAKWQEEST